MAPNVDGVKHGRGGVEDGSVVPVFNRPKQGVREVREGPERKKKKEWRRMDDGVDGELGRSSSGPSWEISRSPATEDERACVLAWGGRVEVWALFGQIMGVGDGPWSYNREGGGAR